MKQDTTNRYTSSYNGFTFVEFIITIGLMVIILWLAVPYFKNMIMDRRIAAQRDMLINALNYARTNALNQNIITQVCPYSAPSSTSCGANWQAGWIIATLPSSGASTLLQAYSPGPNDPTLALVPIGGITASTVSFDPNGISTTQARFKICDTRGGSSAQSINVLPTGLISTNSVKGVTAWDGGAITCP